MKTRIAFSLLAVSALVFSPFAGANNCPNEMKAIDAKLKSSPSLSEADMKKVKELRAEGEKFHKEGKHDQSMQSLQEAKKLLGI
ncbi:hypothetical protein GCM10027343_42160 [Noviherbaspirillum agri]